MDLLKDLRQAVLDGNKEQAGSLTERALEAEHTPGAILHESLIRAMDIVGEEYEKEIRYLPEMLVSAEAMKGALTVLRPHLTYSEVRAAGTVVIGTVEGDLHDIGQNLVAMMLEGAGFEVINLGADTPATAFVTAIQEADADIVALSALLTTTRTQMREVIQTLRQAGLKERIKVMIGGAPVTQEFADQIGADGYAPDAAAAARLARRLIEAA
ncbi:MAG: corrinoid protein [Candidatus Bipolaricaulia bacterium]